MKYIKKGLFFIFLLSIISLKSQDTFSIVAVDSTTKEVGSAGASCVDLFSFVKEPDFIGELFPGKGAINTQASYDEFNQGNAGQKMMEDSTPKQIVDWLAANDVSATPQFRQYGVVAFVKGSPNAAGYTGANCMDWKGHRAGPNYCIQGNILLGQKVIDSIEARFLREKGDLKTKLMAAMQGAKMVGADTRCAPNNSSTLFAYLKVAKATDLDGSNPSFLIKVKTRMNDKKEPIDSLQKLFNEKTKISEINAIDQSNWTFERIHNGIIVTNKSDEQIGINIYNIVGQLITHDIIPSKETKTLLLTNQYSETNIISIILKDKIEHLKTAR